MDRDRFDLTPEEEVDVLALIAWAFTSKPGIPATDVLRSLYSRLIDRFAAV